MGKVVLPFHQLLLSVAAARKRRQKPHLIIHVIEEKSIL